MRPRLDPVDLTADELAERARLVPERHVVELSNGFWVVVKRSNELAGVVVGYEGASLLSPLDPESDTVDDDPWIFELCHIMQFMEAWRFAKLFGKFFEATERARGRERWEQNWRRPRTVGTVLQWSETGDPRGSEPEWKRRRRAARARVVNGRPER